MTARDRPAATCCGPSGRSARTRWAFWSWHGARARGRRAVPHPDPAGTYLVTPSRRRPPCPAGQPSGVRQATRSSTATWRSSPVSGLLAADTEALALPAQGRPARVPAGADAWASTSPPLLPAWLAVGAAGGRNRRRRARHDDAHWRSSERRSSAPTGRREAGDLVDYRRGCEPSSRTRSFRSPCRWRCRPWQPPALDRRRPAGPPGPYRWSRPRRSAPTAWGNPLDMLRRAARRWPRSRTRGPRPGGDVHRRRARDRGQRAHLVLVRAGGSRQSPTPSGRGAAMAPAGATEARGAGDAGAPDLGERRLRRVLRLYPPGWLITRKALTDDVVGGHVIPAGALVLISPTWSTATPPQFPRTGPPGLAGLIPSVSIPLASWRIRRRRSTAATSPSAPARGCASGARWRAPRAPWCSLSWPGVPAGSGSRPTGGTRPDGDAQAEARPADAVAPAGGPGSQRRHAPGEAAVGGCRGA